MKKGGEDVRDDYKCRIDGGVFIRWEVRWGSWLGIR